MGILGNEADLQQRSLLTNKVAELVADDQGRYLECNEQAVEMLGYSRQELMTMSVWDLTPGADQIQGLLLWQEFIRVGFNAGLYRLTRKDGSELEVKYKAVANVSPGRHLSRLERIGPLGY
jgi:PAS domain S-box-containing protein